MSGWIPRNCPVCHSKKISKVMSAGSAVGTVFDLVGGIITLGAYLAVKPKGNTTWNYTCKKCKFEWQAVVEDRI